MPFGCMGGFHNTVEVVSDMVTTPTISTIPGAGEYGN